MKSLIKKNLHVFWAFLLFSVLLIMSGNSQAQVYYVTTDGTGTSSSSNDALYRMNYDGTSNSTLSSNFTQSPSYLALDPANDRAFIYEAFNTDKAIKVVKISTGAVLTTISMTNAVIALKYDPASGYIYYLTSDGTATTVSAADALCKVKPDGTGNTTLISSVCKSPLYIAGDFANSKLYIYESLFSDHGFLTINLTNNSVATTTALTTTSLPSGIIINGVDYDPVSNYLYYLTSDNSFSTTATSDGISKIHPDGTGYAVVATAITASPANATFDLGNNRAYVYEAFNANRAIKEVNWSTGTAVVTSRITLSGLPSSTSVFSMAVPYRAVVSTNSISTVGSTSATLGGNITQSDATVTDRGVVYSSSNATPTISDSKASNGTGTGSFSASVSGLNGTTTYYVRAYATSGAGTAYGAVNTFTTTSNDATLSAFTISSGTLNPSFSSGTITYTASVASSTASITITPTRNQSNATIKVNGTAVTSGSASGNISLAVGDSAIPTVVTAQDGSTTKTYTVTVTRPKAAQTITFNALSAKTYGNSDFAPGASASSGLGVTYTSDNTAVATIVSGNIHIVAPGTANITAGQAGDASNSAATSVSQALTVGKASITVTATAASKNYGDNDPTFAYTVTTGALVGTDAFTGTLTRDAGVNAGTYNITQGTLALSANYTLSFVANTFTINKRPITIQPVAVTKVYGDSDPTYTYNISSGSLASGDGFTGSFTRVTGETPGDYALSVGTKKPVNATTGADQSSNYNLTFISNNLTITKRLLTLQPNPATKVYGAADPVFPYKLTGTLAPGEGITGTFGRPAGENAGIYALTLGTKRPINATTGAATDAYYTISFVSDNLTITKLSEVITVSPQSKTYGDADPVLTYHYSNALPFSDTFSGSVTRSPGESIGSYNITQGTLALNNTNYNIVSFTGSTFTINAKAINVTANAQTKTYGDADPALTYTADALVSGDSFTGALTRVAGEAVGAYAINKGGLALSSNYAINYTGNNLAIGQKVINVTANAQTKTYGDADPALTYTADALVSGDTFSGSLTRDPGETAGAYNITQGSLALNTNYALNYTGNSLTIGKANLSYVATPVSKNYLAANPAFTGTVTGFISGETQASATTGTLSFTTTATASSPQGSYPINGSGLSAANYNFSQAPANSTALSIVLSSDAALSNLSISQGTLNTPFDAGTFQYFANVANNVTSFDLTAIVNQANATMTINGTPLTSGLATTLPLSAGTNNFTIVVTAQDGSTTQSYLVGVNRALSSNNLLSSITMSGVTLNPSFDSGTLSYTSSVGNLVDATDINATPADNNAVAQVAGNRVSAVTSYHQSLVVGDNPVTVTGIAQNGDTKDYVVTITRAPSSDASLSAINTTGFSLIESFSATTYSYTSNVVAGVAQVNFVPVSTNNGATITVNGTAVNSSGFTATLSFGVNTYNIGVAAQDGATTSTYTLKITRALSSDATLSVLSIPYQTAINESFDPAVLNYTANLADSTITGLPLTAVSTDVNATVKINGDVVPRFVNYIMAVHGGDNTFNIVVTPQDNSAAKTYTLVLTRAGQAPPLLSPDASLAAISISGTGYSHNFNFAFDALTPLTVPNKTTGVRLHPVTGNAGATTTINTVAIAYDASTDLLPLNEGDNTFDVVVTAADGVHQTTTTLHINRLPAADVNLASLTLNAGTLSPAFVGTTLTYTASVPYSVSSLNVTPVANATDATVTVGATTINAGTPSASVALNVGLPNRVRITVTAADGVNTQTYSVNVTRLAPDASLASVTVSGGSSVTRTDATTYATQVSYNTAVLAVTPTAVDPGSTITVDGNPVVSGSPSAGVTLDNTTGATTTIPIVVTASDGTTTQSYSLAVTHLAQPASGDATLASLSTSAGTLSPAFNMATTAYQVTVDGSVSSLTLSPVVNNANASVKVNGVALVAGKATINLISGNNTIITTVTAQDGTVKTYTLLVTRSALSSNVSMSFTMTPSSSFTQLASTGYQYNYTTSVSSSTNSVSITPVSSDASAVITVEGQVVSSGTSSGAIPLNASGTTAVHMHIQAQDGVTARDYAIVVSRNGSSNVSMSFTMTPSSSFTQLASTGYQYNYTTSVSPSTNSVSITPVSSDASAVITVEGQVVSSGTSSGAIPLNASGTTAVHMHIQAQDGVTARDYAIVVSRNGSSNVSMSFTMTPSSSFTQLASTGYQYNYTTSVSSSTNSVSITPVSSDASAVITVEGQVVSSGTSSGAIPLNASGTTAVHMHIQAQDGVTARDYAIVVSRNGSSNVSMSFTMTPSSSFTQLASTGYQYNYTTSVSPSTNSVSITPVSSDASAVITVEGQVVSSGTSSGAIPLNASGTTAVHMHIQAQDGVTARDYAIVVSRNGSSNVSMSFTMTPSSSFTQLASTGYQYNYTTSVSSSTNSVSITPVSSDASAVITVEGQVVSSGTSSGAIPLNASGTTAVHMHIQAQDGVTARDYAIVVSRNGSSNVSMSFTMTPSSSFTQLASTGYQYNYTTSVSSSTNSVSITPVSSDASAVITVEGQVVSSGTSSGAIPLNASGTTAVHMHIQAQDGVTARDYAIVVSRNGSSNVSMSFTMTPSSSFTQLASTGYQYNYTTSVSPSTNSVSITPVSSDASAVITVEGQVVSSGTSSGAIPLNASGTTAVHMHIQAQDGVTARDYAIVVSRRSVGSFNIVEKTITGISQKSNDITSDELIVHQALSPNGDGQNDILTIDGIENHTDNHLSIMNAGGALVYDVKGYGTNGNVFDGHSNKTGAMQKPGTYYYSLEYSDGKETKRKTGYIIIKY